MEIVETAFFILVDVAKDIYTLGIRDTFCHVFDPCMFFTGTVIETSCIFQMVHGLAENIRIGWYRDNIGVVIFRKPVEVCSTVKAAVDYKQYS